MLIVERFYEMALMCYFDVLQTHTSGREGVREMSWSDTHGRPL
jgi:hypothetical protein